MRRWFDDVITTDYVFDKDTDELYNYTQYLNKVRDIRLDESREMSFEEFKRTYPSAKSTQVPGDVKLVLEDGRLGTTERFANQLGTAVPALSGTEVFKGEAFTLTSSDDNYFSKITELVMDGSSQALRSDAYLRQYKLSDDKKSLTIYPSAFNGYYPPLVGEHKLKIKATGYEVREFALRIKEKELDVSLKLPERAFKVNEDVSIDVMGSASDISEFKSLIHSVHIVKPDNSNRNVYTASVGGRAGNDYYEFTSDSLVLKGGLFKTEGEYQLHIRYSNQPNKVIKFTVKKEDPVPTLEVVPTVKEFKFDKIARSPFSRYYELVFDTSVMSVEDVYKFTDNASAKVEVNGKAYAKKGSERELNSSRNSYVVWDDATMYLTEDAFNKEENLIKISVDGYETFEYIIKKEVDITPNIVIRSDMNALRVGLVKKNEYDAYYLSKFKNTNMKVSVNGVEFSKYNRSGRLPAATYSLYSDGATGNVLGIYVSNVNLDLSQPVDISIKLDGYEELTINYTE